MHLLFIFEPFNKRIFVILLFGVGILLQYFFCTLLASSFPGAVKANMCFVYPLGLHIGGYGSTVRYQPKKKTIQNNKKSEIFYKKHSQALNIYLPLINCNLMQLGKYTGKRCDLCFDSPGPGWTFLYAGSVQ